VFLKRERERKEGGVFEPQENIVGGGGESVVCCVV
jgi:hypothetical protein